MFDFGEICLNLFDFVYLTQLCTNFVLVCLKKLDIKKIMSKNFRSKNNLDSRKLGSKKSPTKFWSPKICGQKEGVYLRKSFYFLTKKNMA